MAAVGLSFTSCKQEDEPQYKNPTTFTVAEPAFKDNAFRTSAEMTNPETFNLFCTQPDYGYSAICSYSALVTLDENEAKKDGKDIDPTKWIELENSTPAQAAMAIKTFELGAAVNKLLGITDQADFDAKNIYNNAYKCYLKAVCEIPNIEGSRIVSSNTVSYNKVYVRYAEKKPAWIYICGDVQTKDGVANGYLAPAASNYDKYENFRLYEPKDLIGKKLFVGTFWLTPKKDNPDPGNPDDTSAFRFFTELGGWVVDFSLGSNEADFFTLPITDKWVAGFSGDVVKKGLGNWGIHTPTVQPVTIVVDTDQLKIFVKEGEHTVEFVGRDPEFK